jgi:hypothetical protein
MPSLVNEVATVRRLLGLAHVREQVDTPMFAFGQRAAHIAAKHAPMLDVRIAAGADVTLKSEWKNGPYTVLDNTSEETTRLLLSRGPGSRVSTTGTRPCWRIASTSSIAPQHAARLCGVRVGPP